METLKEWVSVVERANLYGTNGNERVEEYSIQVESPFTDYAYKVTELLLPPLPFSEYLVDEIKNFKQEYNYEYRMDCRIELKPVKPYLIQVTVTLLHNKFTIANKDAVREEFCINLDYFKTSNSITDLLKNVLGEFSYRETYYVE